MNDSGSNCELIMKFYDGANYIVMRMMMIIVIMKEIRMIMIIIIVIKIILS